MNTTNGYFVLAGIGEIVDEIDPETNETMSVLVVPYGDEIELICTVGYRVNGRNSVCGEIAFTPEADVAFQDPPFCEPLACASRDPLWTPAFDVFPDDPDAFHGKVECTGPNVYGQQCLMICDDGYAFPATDADLDALADEGIDIDLPEDGEYFLGNKTLNCVDSSNFPITFDGPKYCEPMICDGDDSAWEHMTDGDCWNTTHPINGTCKRKCELGYALGGIRSLHDAWVEFTCADVDKQPVMVVDSPYQSCEEIPCGFPPSDLSPKISLVFLTPPGGNDVCDQNVPMLSGAECDVVCAGDAVLSVQSATRITCRGGEYYGCVDGVCASDTADLVSPPACFASTSKIVIREVVYSSLVLELLGTIGQTDAELQTAKNAIARGLQLHFLLDPGQVTVTALLQARRLRRSLQASGKVVAEFFVDVSDPTTLGAVEAGLTSLSEEEGLEELRANVQNVFAAELPGVELASLRVLPPRKDERAFEIPGPPIVVDDNRGVHWAAIVFPVLVVLLGAAGYFVHRHRKSNRVRDEVPYS
jgi:hypothetical protein